MDHLAGSLVLIGLGVLCAGIVGVALPPGHRPGAVLALVAGAGTGLLVLGLSGDAVTDERGIDVFFVGSVVGLATVIACLVLVGRQAVRDDRPERRAASHTSVR